MRKSFLLLIMLLGFMTCSSRNELYKSKNFTIYKNKVVQGDYQATVISDTEMKSDFQSAYKMPTKKVMDFKFSLNGLDNERYPGEDHHIVLNPVDGQQLSPIYSFGDSDPEEALYNELLRNDYLENDVALTIRCDMRKVLKDFDELGYFVLYTGEKFFAKDFKGVFLAGSTLPLEWNFTDLINRPQFQLQDADADGIYEVTINISKFQKVSDTQFTNHWKLQKDISQLPQFKSDIPLLNALYNMSLEEMLLDIRDDQCFMAGAKWPGVWTRDISYSIILSLAAIQPEVAKNSLMKKVDDGRIIQDTGTGGSWPVSSDRMIWSVAAWEIYKSNGDMEWLKSVYEIIKKSADADLEIVFDKEYGLFRGESSFLDWREQTYPRWMEPKDIYQSMNLGTNALFYETFRVLGEMAKILGEDGNKYKAIAEQVKRGINKHLWLYDKGYYAQYLYGRNNLSLSTRSETLGEALCILFDIADDEQKERILSSMPVVNFGPTCIFPQIPNIPPYHNNGIWPFVVTYWTLAAKDGGNYAAMEHGLASIYRAAVLYLSNYENMVAQTGDFMGTEINSPRQLWSVAGDLATIYKVFFGMKYHSDKLAFAPAIPKQYGGKFHLTNYPYGKAILDIKVDGFGDEIKTFKLDGEVQANAVIPLTLSGNHSIEIQMAKNEMQVGELNLVKNQFAPETPEVSYKDGKLIWEKVDNAIGYLIMRNGRYVEETTYNEFAIEIDDNYSEYQIVAVDNDFTESFYSNPLIVTDKIQKVSMNDLELDIAKSQKDGISINADKSGNYILIFDYSNGAGPVNTSNKCAIRKLYVNDYLVVPIIFPQRGADNWESVGQTLPVEVKVNAGVNQIDFVYDEDCENMNKVENRAVVRGVKIYKMK